MCKLSVICVFAIRFLIQTDAFAATEFYVMLHDAGRRVHCDSLQIQNSAVQCDDGALTITYDAAAINSITVISDGRQHNFHHLTQDEIQQINAFNINKSDSNMPNTNEKIEKKYTCSGKVYCSEMTSCEEAMFYQRNCPGTKMDGDGDGIPCERQWCGH